MKPKHLLLCSIIGLALPLAATAAFPEWESSVRTDLSKMADHLSATLKPWTPPDKIFRVEDFGAVADGATVNTKAINQAIAECAAKGGGVVRFTRGDYVTGTLDLKSGVMLEVLAGARVLGSTNLADYPDRIAKRRTVMDSNMDIRQSLIYAEGLERIGIRGPGVIDGRGESAHFPGKETIHGTPGRPFLMRVIDCRDVVVDGVTLRSSASWMEDFLNCENVISQNVTVENYGNWNNDGLDLDGCRNVIVRHDVFIAEDDGMCFKGASLKPMENVLVEDCKFYSACNALKFGTDSQGDFRNVLVRNCEVGGPAVKKGLMKRPLANAGIAWEIVDGGTLENVMTTNIHIIRAESPIFLCLGNRGRVLPDDPKPAPGKLRRVIFDGLTGSNNGKRGSIISGIPGARIEDVVVVNVNLSIAGGATAEPSSKKIPEKITGYPDAANYGAQVPAYGFWVRHAEEIIFSNVRVIPKQPDARPLIAQGEDVKDLKATACTGGK